MRVQNSDRGLLHVAFNQDQSCVSVGTNTGYKLFTTHPFGKFYEEETGGYKSVEMLFSSSALVALVGDGSKPGSSPHMLRLVNTKRKTTVCEVKFPTPILTVRLNRKRVIVVLVERIDVFDITNMKSLASFTTAPNPDGLCALAASSTNCFLAYPTKTDGELVIYDANECIEVRKIQAHQGPLECFVFNQTGDLIASASDKGTVVRVFRIPSGEKSFMFRRGSYPVTITDLAFSVDSQFLAVSSASETVHIFKLDSPPPPPPGSWNILPTAYSYLPTSYLPAIVTDILEPARNFAHARLPEIGVPTICGFNIGSQRVIVVTASGVAYEFEFDLQNGGECKFVQKSSILTTEPSASATA